MRKFLTVLAALATLSLTNCGYNAIQTNDEQVKSAWSEVVNQYQRRADLVPRSREFREGLRATGEGRSSGRHKCTRQGRLGAGDA